MKLKKIILLLGVLSLCGCSSNSVDKNTDKKTDVNVFIAASLSNAMEEIEKNYESANGNIDIIYNADSSGTLRTQIKEGAECDIFFSAAEKQMNELNQAGFIKENSITPLLTNEVVLIKPKDGDTSVTGFDNISLAKNIALAGEDVPVGSYSREIFENMGITDDVSSMEINECANVTAVLTAVAEGANEIGIVYSTDAASMKDKVDVIAPAPEDALKTPVIYPVGLVKNEKADDAQSKASEDFIEYLKSDDAKSVFEEYGFSAEK